MRHNGILFIILFGLLIPITSLSQQPKTKNLREEGKHEVYEIVKIKGSGRIKQGSYQQYLADIGKPEILLIEGSYNDNKKYGIWTYYNLENDILFSYDYSNDSIIFVNDSASRIVQTYNYTIGVSSKIFDYDSKPNKTIFGREETRYFSIDFRNINLSDTLLPIYFEGDNKFYDILFDLYATVAKIESRNFISSGVYLSPFVGYILISISSEGITQSITVNGLGKDLNERYQQSLGLKINKWIPARINGENVSFVFAVPIIYKYYEHLQGYEGHTFYFCRPDLINYSFDSTYKTIGWP